MNNEKEFIYNLKKDNVKFFLKNHHLLDFKIGNKNVIYLSLQYNAIKVFLSIKEHISDKDFFKLISSKVDDGTCAINLIINKNLEDIFENVVDLIIRLKKQSCLFEKTSLKKNLIFTILKSENNKILSIFNNKILSEIIDSKNMFNTDMFKNNIAHILSNNKSKQPILLEIAKKLPKSLFNSKNHNNQIPLHLAANNNLELFKIILLNTKFKKIYSKNGELFINEIILSFNTEEDIIDKLNFIIQKKLFSINITNNRKNSILHQALFLKKDKVASFLIKNKANLILENERGISPIFFIFNNYKKFPNSFATMNSIINLNKNILNKVEILKNTRNKRSLFHVLLENFDFKYIKDNFNKFNTKNNLSMFYNSKDLYSTALSSKKDVQEKINFINENVPMAMPLFASHSDNLLNFYYNYGNLKYSIQKLNFYIFSDIVKYIKNEDEIIKLLDFFELVFEKKFKKEINSTNYYDDLSVNYYIALFIAYNLNYFKVINFITNKINNLNLTYNKKIFRIEHNISEFNISNLMGKENVPNYIIDLYVENFNVKYSFVNYQNDELFNKILNKNFNEENFFKYFNLANNKSKTIFILSLLVYMLKNNKFKYIDKIKKIFSVELKEKYFQLYKKEGLDIIVETLIKSNNKNALEEIKSFFNLKNLDLLRLVFVLTNYNKIGMQKTKDYWFNFLIEDVALENNKEINNKNLKHFLKLFSLKSISNFYLTELLSKFSNKTKNNDMVKIIFAKFITSNTFLLRVEKLNTLKNFFHNLIYKNFNILNFLSQSNIGKEEFFIDFIDFNDKDKEKNKNIFNNFIWESKNKKGTAFENSIHRGYLKVIRKCSDLNLVHTPQLENLFLCSSLRSYDLSIFEKSNFDIVLKYIAKNNYIANIAEKINSYEGSLGFVVFLLYKENKEEFQKIKAHTILKYINDNYFHSSKKENLYSINELLEDVFLEWINVTNIEELNEFKKLAKSKMVFGLADDYKVLIDKKILEKTFNVKKVQNKKLII